MEAMAVGAARGPLRIWRTITHLTAQRHSMEDQESRKLAGKLERLVAGGAESKQIAGMVASSWKAIDAALSPIIGGKGVAALYARSLHLAGARHAWLRNSQGAEGAMDLSKLEATLSQQGSAAAAAAGGTHLEILYELLVSLIGASLTGQLLASAWDPLERAPAKD